MSRQGQRQSRTTPDAATIAAVAELRAAGVSVAQSGSQLGISKGVVSGIVWRHVLGKPSDWASRPKPVAKPKRRRPKRKPAAKPKPARKAPVVVVAAPAPEQPWVAGGCRWITSEDRPWRFCCAPIARLGGSYCAEHERRAWVDRRAPRLEARTL